jgi:hypothetical protein
MTCPYCKEEIKDGAIKCKHCGSMLDSTDNKSSGANAPTDRFKTQRFIAISMMLFGLFYSAVSAMGPYRLTFIPPKLPSAMIGAGLIWLIAVSVTKRKR